MPTASQPSFESERRAPGRLSYAWGPRGPAETGTRQTGTRGVGILPRGFLFTFNRQAGVVRGCHSPADSCRGAYTGATMKQPWTICGPNMGYVCLTRCDRGVRCCGVVQVSAYRSDGLGV